jgi:hypothetical protein
MAAHAGHYYANACNISLIHNEKYQRTSRLWIFWIHSRVYPVQRPERSTGRYKSVEINTMARDCLSR